MYNNIIHIFMYNNIIHIFAPLCRRIVKEKAFLMKPDKEQDDEEDEGPGPRSTF
jgi:hypothetical protein